MEILYAASINYRKLFPTILSSDLGYTIYGLITDFSPPWGRRAFSFQPKEIPLFLLAAVLTGWVGLFFRLFSILVEADSYNLWNNLEVT